MNMNQYNQVTVPLALMNAMATAMQTQPQLQSAGGGAPNMVNGLTMPQQQASFAPNFVLQAPHLLQTFPGPSSIQQPGGQPWVLPALQTISAPQPSGSQSTAAAAKQPTVDEIVAGVVAAMKATPRETAPNKSIAVGFTPDDERILVNALQKAKAEGLTLLQGFSKLDNVNNHTTAAWKDYFITHVERLGPKVYPQVYANTPTSISSKGVAGGSRYDLSTYASGGPSASSALPRHRITGGDASDSEQPTPDEDAAVGNSASHRSKRGAPAVEYHEETYIPHLPPGIKPKAPRRDPQHESLRFTKEDKIFFIHYLKYRLRRGPVPSKEQLCRELGEQAPHHNGDSWKRHWDNACRLPNEIYIQARKRVNNNPQEPRGAPRPQQGGSSLVESSEEKTSPETSRRKGTTRLLSLAMILCTSHLSLERRPRRQLRHKSDGVVDADAESLMRTSGAWRSTLWRSASAMDGRPSKRRSDGRNSPGAPRTRSAP
ncbi:hypothetical protein LXA43DRAFT_66650 [Ganoderma leucocontextum]|nr:hypothetical protein LXA43DRAFT_66650 [Ganoderma leucocontextum]